MAEAEYDGANAAQLERALGVPRALILDRVTSTMDVAHDLARRGAPGGTLVVAEEQTAGRGRQGKSWTSERGTGIWLTLLERPTDPRSAEVLSLRVGVAAARSLRPFTREKILVKWPNDLFLSAGKLAGILIEARWSGASLDYVLIGFGVNVAGEPGAPGRAAIGPVGSRANVLLLLVPAMRRAAAAPGYLADEEVAAFRRRARGLGCRCLQPARGTVEGISHTGALLVREDGGTVTSHRTGSLLFEENAP